MLRDCGDRRDKECSGGNIVGLYMWFVWQMAVGEFGFVVILEWLDGLGGLIGSPAVVIYG